MHRSERCESLKILEPTLMSHIVFASERHTTTLPDKRTQGSSEALGSVAESQMLGCMSQKMRGFASGGRLRGRMWFLTYCSMPAQAAAAWHRCNGVRGTSAHKPSGII